MIRISRRYISSPLLTRCCHALSNGIAATLMLLGTLLNSQWVAAIEGPAQLNIVSFESPPYVFSQSSGKEGLAILLMRSLMDRAGIEFDLNLMPAKRALRHALTTANTCVFPVERSQEREVQFSWVSPITISRHALYRNPANPSPNLRVLNDAKYFKVGSHLGSSIGEYLKSLDMEVELVRDNGANIQKLLANRIDFWSADTLVADYYARENGIDLEEPELVFFTTIGALACNANVPQHIINRLNTTLREMHFDGTMKRLSSNFESPKK